jgi:hypothetical protein
VTDREALRQLDGEISKGRDELGVLVAELDRRRHRIFNLKAQLKQHVVEISLAGVAVTAITVAAIWLVRQRARRRQSFVARASRFGTAVSRMIANPDLVATGPTIPRQLFTAVAAAALGSATRTIVAKGIQSVMNAPRHNSSRSTQPREGTPRLHGIRKANVERSHDGNRRDIDERVDPPDVAARGSSRR